MLLARLRATKQFFARPRQVGKYLEIKSLDIKRKIPYSHLR